ncbi:MAG TPA: hypothetical protein VMM79_01580 [Longimicrobiales bacterium]|jgi:monomeric isocitrate dehydrogenase|nr:hypothetical protein [Longimicrobiales bacterium]
MTPDYTAIIAIIMGSLMFLIPIAGFTARFAMKPIVESIAKLRDSSAKTEAIQLVERRLALLEQEVQSVSNIKDEVARLVDELEFQRKLAAPTSRTGAE